NISLTLRIGTLSAGIGSPSLAGRGAYADNQRSSAATLKGWPTSNRNRWPTWIGTGGRLQIGISGRLQIGMGGRLPPESAPDAPRLALGIDLQRAPGRHASIAVDVRQAGVLPRRSARQSQKAGTTMRQRRTGVALQCLRSFNTLAPMAPTLSGRS